jgi:hypothetical protein
MSLEHSEFSRNQLLTLFHKPCKFRLAPADKLNQVLWYGHLEPHHYDACAQRFGFGLGGCPRAYLTVVHLQSHAARFTAGRFSFRLIALAWGLLQSASAGAGSSQKGILRPGRGNGLFARTRMPARAPLPVTGGRFPFREARMTYKSKFPLPVHATGFRFLTDPSLPTHAVLEVDTAANPLRVDFDKEQLEKLARDATLAAAKCSPKKGQSIERPRT